MLWRDLPCVVSLYNHSDAIRTSRDMRNEVRPGDVLFVAGTSFDVLGGDGVGVVSDEGESRGKRKGRGRRRPR